MDYDPFATASGNAVVVALDHGLSSGAIEGFEDPARVVEALRAVVHDGAIGDEVWEG